MVILILRLRVIIQVAVNCTGLLNEPLNRMFGMPAFRTSSGMGKMSVRGKPKTTMLVSAIILFVTNDTQLLRSFSIDRLRVIVPVAVDSPCLFKKPLRILRDFNGIRLAGALRTPLLLNGMIIRFLLEFTVNRTNNSDFLPPSLQVDLRIIVFVPVNGMRLVKEILQPFLPAFIAFNTAASGTLLTRNMTMRSLLKLPMNRTDNSYLPVAPSIFDQRIIILITVNLASLFNERLPRVRKSLADFLNSTSRATFSRQVHSRSLHELSMFWTYDTNRCHTVNIDHTGIVISIPVNSFCFSNKIFCCVSLRHFLAEAK